jgi:nitroreductase
MGPPENAMEFFNVIECRHTIRNFTSKPVEIEKLDRIVSAANAAPSAANMQAYEIFVVTDVKDRAALAKAACGQGFVLVAPVSLVFCANPARNYERFGERGRALYSIQDATIACSYAQLAAAAQDLGSVWVGAFDPDSVRHVIGVSEKLEPVAILTLGYTEGEPEIKPRRPLDDLVHTL